MGTSLTVIPDGDSDNSQPTDLSFKEDSDGSIIIEATYPDRTFRIAKDDWDKIVLLYGRK